MSEALRSDARATRELLVAAVGTLLADRGLAFGLADVAAEAGTSLATVYRHLPSKEIAIDRYLSTLVAGWEREIEEATEGLDGWRRLDAACRAWVEEAWRWGRSAVFVRSSVGIIQRRQAGDPIIEANWRQLQPVVEELVTRGDIPEQSVEWAVLLWNTLFDERVIVDLAASGWSSADVASSLTETLRLGLLHPPERARGGSDRQVGTRG